MIATPRREGHAIQRKVGRHGRCHHLRSHLPRLPRAAARDAGARGAGAAHGPLRRARAYAQPGPRDPHRAAPAAAKALRGRSRQRRGGDVPAQPPLLGAGLGLRQAAPPARHRHAAIDVAPAPGPLSRPAGRGRRARVPALLPAHLPLADRRLPQSALGEALRRRRGAPLRRHRGRDAPAGGSADHDLPAGAGRRQGQAAARRGLRDRPHAGADPRGAPGAQALRARPLSLLRAGGARGALRTCRMSRW